MGRSTWAQSFEWFALRSSWASQAPGPPVPWKSWTNRTPRPDQPPRREALSPGKSREASVSMP